VSPAADRRIDAAFQTDRWVANYADLPIGDIARAIQARAEELGLVWRLRPATVAAPGPSGQTRIVYDGDTVQVDAVSIIGRLPTDARVMGLISPPAGNHVVGFLGADFPPSVALEAIGRPYLYIAPSTIVLSSTTYADMTGFAIYGAPRAQYMIRARVAVGGPLGSDVKIRWTVPAGASMTRHILGIPSTATGSNVTSNQLQSVRRSQGTDAGIGTFGGAAPGNDFTVHWEDSLVTMGTTAGTVQLQAGLVAAAGAGSFWAGSQMEIQRYR
jgi:hypothetical protein